MTAPSIPRPAARRAVSWDAFEVAVLVLALAALSLLLVPAHTSSIWMDREFTGGVGPLANRLVDGERLYTDGMHSPLPPLSFALMRLLGGGDATWLTGSIVNYLFQVLTLGVSYLALRHVFGRRAAFVATLCSVPVFLSLNKSVVYDPMVQSCVALAAWVIAALPPRWPILLGVVSGVALMTKQSTATGIVAGTALALLVTPMAGRPFGRDWWQSVVTYGASVVATMALVLAALIPWADPGGFAHDVLVTGAEAKGKQADVIAKLRAWGDEVVLFGLAFAAIAVVAVVLDRRFGLRARFAGGKRVSWWDAAREADDSRRGALALSGAAVAGSVLGALSWALDSTRVADPSFTLAELTPRVLSWRYTGTFAAVVVTGLVVLWARRGSSDEPAQRFLRVFFVLAAAAFTMSLSSPELRWTYDNNPLIPFAFACVITGAAWIAAVAGGRSLRRRAVLTAVATAVVSTLAWASLADQIWVAEKATVSWSEIEHLDGAELRPASGGMRTLVGEVRRLAAPDEPVLLLPEDPNVQAWFERPRPHLTSAMVFADQYWDRYVDEDFERLADAPPKVIVIGPRDFWRQFSRLVHDGKGAERLVDRVRRELLVRGYDRRPAVRFQWHQWPYSGDPGYDWLDVWVRRGRAPGD